MGSQRRKLLCRSLGRASLVLVAVLVACAGCTHAQTRRLQKHDEASSTVADWNSPHNYEANERPACDAEKMGMKLVHAAIPLDWQLSLNDEPHVIEEWRGKWKDFVKELPEYQETLAGKSKGRGIVFAAGSEGFNPLLVALRMLRSMGCKLPIEVWHFSGELNEFQLQLLATVDVTPRDVGAEGNFLRIELNPSMAKPYDIKPTAILNSAFEEVMFLDADNLPTRDPTYLFDTPEFKSTGAVFFGDFWRTHAENPMWKIFEVPCYDEPEFESGQLLVNKRLSWKALNLAWWMNRNHPFFYRLVFGDKDTFRFAWKAVKQPYHFIKYSPAEVGFVTEREQQFCGHTLGHHDPQGKIVFLHAHLVKWHEWKGQYPYTHFRDRWNGFRTMRPWTHAQDVLDDDAMATYRPNWMHGWPQLRCLQYVKQRPEETHVQVRMEHGDPNMEKEVVPEVPLSERFDTKAFYQHFDKAEGPLLAVSPP